jgi:hypothetical protein
MTEPVHVRESLPLDSTAQLLSRITTRIGTQLRGCRATSDRAIVPWHACFQRCRRSPTLRVDSVLRLGIARTRPRPLSDRRQPDSL